MSWARYDDNLPMNKKWIGKLRPHGVNGAAALGLHLLANTYCRHNGTAGVVEPHVPDALVGRCGVKLAGLLVDAGMFDVRPGGGWTIHDYAEFHDPNDPNPDRSAAERQREVAEKRAEAGRRGGLAKASKQVAGYDFATWQTSSKRLANPSPEPEPVPIRESSPVTQVSACGQLRDDEDGGLSRVTQHIGTHLAERNKARSPRAYAAKCAKEAAVEYGSQIVDLCRRYPTAAASQIAAYVLGEKSALNYCQPDEQE